MWQNCWTWGGNLLFKHQRWIHGYWWTSKLEWGICSLEVVSSVNITGLNETFNVLINQIFTMWRENLIYAFWMWFLQLIKYLQFEGKTWCRLFECNAIKTVVLIIIVFYLLLNFVIFQYMSMLLLISQLVNGAATFWQKKFKETATIWQIKGEEGQCARLDIYKFRKCWQKSLAIWLWMW